MSSKKTSHAKKENGGSHKKKEVDTKAVDSLSQEWSAGDEVEWKHRGDVHRGRILAILTEPTGNIKATIKNPMFWVQETSTKAETHLPAYGLHMPGELAKMDKEKEEMLAEKAEKNKQKQEKKDSKSSSHTTAAAATPIAPVKKDTSEMKAAPPSPHKASAAAAVKPVAVGASKK